ncbi:uncharacterized protein UTRI_03770_B [Ustilago trichophora]|uniref:Uncharacterized protein n=1 Tax=Ustilago trichophora TaxID=86804 RepID=A0A5C3DZ37_9BASI|nr:uncharacterized protein UTRI_03770_B [Ustilago trichophora]
MESFLSIIFPCCFPSARHSSSPYDERSPLLANPNHPSSSSSRNSISDNGGTAASLGGVGGLEAKKAKRKQNSILPTPAYDANVLRGIVDEFLGKIVAVDSSVSTGGGEKGGGSSLGMLLNSSVDDGGVEQHGGPTQPPAKQNIPFPTPTKHLTPIHTLRITLSSTSSSPTPQKLIDIWSDQTSQPPPTPTPTTLSYSAAVKRGSKRSINPKPKPVQSVEQSTYQNLTELIRQKPLVHTWELDDDPLALSVDEQR